VLDGDPAPPPPKKGEEQQPSTFQRKCCSQTAGWIQMPLNTVVGLGSGHIVLDGDPAPPPKNGHINSQFLTHVCCGENCWMNQDATWYGGRPRPWPHCVRWGPRSSAKGAQQPHPSFWPMSLVAKRLPITTTAEHLLYRSWYSTQWPKLWC